MLEIALTTAIKYVAIAVGTTGVATYIAFKYKESKFGRRRNGSRNKRSSFAGIFDREKSAVKRMSDIDISQAPQGQTEIPVIRCDSVGGEPKAGTTGSVVENTDVLPKEETRIEDSQEVVESPLDRLSKAICSAFEDRLTARGASQDLLEFLNERRLDFDISMENGDVESAGLFLIDFYDELRSKANFVSEGERVALESMADKVKEAMTEVGFEFINLPDWDKGKQRILSVERSPTAEGIQILSTEETGLVFNGRILRKQGVSVITNESEA